MDLTSDQELEHQMISHYRSALIYIAIVTTVGVVLQIWEAVHVN